MRESFFPGSCQIDNGQYTAKGQKTQPCPYIGEKAPTSAFHHRIKNIGGSSGRGLRTPAFCQFKVVCDLPVMRVKMQRLFRNAGDPSRYAHDDEGPDDMPAHPRTALTQVQLSIPVIDGRMALGTWQGVYLFEHRRRPHTREIALHLLYD